MRKWESSSFATSFLENGTLISNGDGQLYIGCGKRSWHSKMPSDQTTTFYAPDFFLREESPYFSHEHTFMTTPTALFQELPPPSRQCPISWEEGSREAFFSQFHQLQELFQKEVLQKGVPFTFARSPNCMTPDLLLQALRKLLSIVNHAPLHLYGFWENGTGILGATPEILFRLGENVETFALAGTMGEHATVEDFIHDPKERTEHQIVVDAISQSLACFGNVSVGEMAILDLGTLKHLITPLSASYATPPLMEELVQALHPTPALGTYPREAGVEWLEGLEERKRFGAPIGWVDRDRACCFVAIRNVQFDDAGLCIGAGCGVVPQSDPTKEWDEIGRKVEATKDLMGLRCYN